MILTGKMSHPVPAILVRESQSDLVRTFPRMGRRDALGKDGLLKQEPRQEWYDVGVEFVASRLWLIVLPTFCWLSTKFFHWLRCRQGPARRGALS